MSFKEKIQGRAWTRDGFLISMDPSLVDLPALIRAFDTDGVYWARSMPESAMLEMLQSCMCFGVYKLTATATNGDTTAAAAPIQEPGKATEEASSTTSTTYTAKDVTFVGLARCVTDFTTFSYLTDVWVDPEYQGFGIGTWLVRCVAEVLEEMPYLRRSILFTGDWERSVPFYEKHMGMDVVEGVKGQGLALMERKGMGHPTKWHLAG